MLQGLQATTLQGLLQGLQPEAVADTSDLLLTRRLPDLLAEDRRHVFDEIYIN